MDRRIKADGAVQYRVRWSGYGAADDDWLDESALGNAQAKVALYNRRPAASWGRQEDGRDDTTDHDEDGDETEDEDDDHDGDKGDDRTVADDDDDDLRLDSNDDDTQQDETEAGSTAAGNETNRAAEASDERARTAEEAELDTRWPLRSW